MVFQLIIKDFRTHKHQIFTRILLPVLVTGSLFNIRFYQWDVYFMIACMATATAGSAFSLLDKKQNTFPLIISLPVTRMKIAIARYLTSLIIIVLGIALFYGNAYLSQFFYSNPKTRFSDLNHLKVLWMAILFLVIHMSICLPAMFQTSLRVSIITFILAIITSIVVIATMFHPGTIQFTPEFQNSTASVASIWVGMLILLVLFSLGITVTRFRNRDL